jgi:arsenite-transporting ATPase
MKLRDLIKRKRDTRYFFFSGKGGVGKTSIASAAAIWLSKKGKKVLIISIDPAHSLSDSFEMEIGDDIKKLGKNLYAVEIDPLKAMQEYKEKFATKIENIEYLKGFGLEETFDIAGMTPGIDEVAAFDKFLQYMGSKDYDIIIFDTAPTGHALRFLSLPDILDSWIGKAIKIRMRFAGIVNMLKKILPFGKPNEASFGTEELDAMKKRIEEAKKILSDPEKTCYSMVMIAEEMSIFESTRALKILEEYKIPVKTIIINQLIPSNPKCEFCTEKRKLQQERMITIQKKFKKFKILKLPMFKEEVKGFRMLEMVGKKLYGYKN